MSCCSSTDSTSTGGFESPRVLEGVLPEIEFSVLPLEDELSFVGGKSANSSFSSRSGGRSGGSSARGCILGPEPSPEVNTLPLVPMAPRYPGENTPRDAEGVAKMNENSADVVSGECKKRSPL
jgi:hypothetical protein